MTSVLKIVLGLVLSAGLAFGFDGLMGARGASAQTEKNGASPSGFDAVVRNDAERMIQEGQETTQPSERYFQKRNRTAPASLLSCRRFGS